MARFAGGTFRTVEDIGRALIKGNPAWAHRDPEELGEKALAHPKLGPLITLAPQDYTDVDWSTAGAKLFGSGEEGGVERESDFLRTAGESVEGLGQFALHPIDTGIEMGKLGLAGMQELEESEPSPGVFSSAIEPLRLLKLMSNIPLSEDTREGAREFGRELKHSVSPEGVQHRPALALSNALIPVPGGAGVKGASMAGKTGRFLQRLKEIRNVIDPSELPITAARFGGRVTKGTLGTAGRGTAYIGKKAFESVQDFANSIRSAESSLGNNMMLAILGFTTGTGPKFIREMIRKGSPEDVIERAVSITDDPSWRQQFLKSPSGGRTLTQEAVSDVTAVGPRTLREQGPQVQREFRGMNQADGELIVATRVLESVDRFKKGMNTAFEKALGELPLDEHIAIPLALRRRAGKALSDMGVKVKGAETREIVPRAGMTEVEELSRVAAGQSTISRKAVPTGEGRLEFPDFGDVVGTTTTISAQGGGRALMRETFLRLINAPDVVTMEDLMHFRRSIDDALSVTTSEVSGEARVALGRLRDIVSDELKDIPGYTDTMGDYEKASLQLFRWEAELGAVPGALTEAGEIRNVKVSTLIENLQRTLAEGKTETPFAVLQELERKGSDPSITPAIIGMGSEALAGTGLAVKSELSQGMRLIAAAGALVGSLGSLYRAPAMMLFSPRGVNELMLRALDPDKLGGSYARGAGLVGEKYDKVRRMAEGAQQAFHKANESSGGQLAKLAAKEGWTIGQLLERLEINLGVEFEEGDLAQSPRASTFLKTIGGIDMPPAAR